MASNSDQPYYVGRSSLFTQAFSTGVMAALWKGLDTIKTVSPAPTVAAPKMKLISNADGPGKKKKIPNHILKITRGALYSMLMRGKRRKKQTRLIITKPHTAYLQYFFHSGTLQYRYLGDGEMSGIRSDVMQSLNASSPWPRALSQRMAIYISPSATPHLHTN